MSKPIVVHGTVRGPRGEPVAAARVYVTAAPVSMPDVAALTGEDGTFTLTLPAPGSYTIECAADQWPPASRTVRVERQASVKLEFQLGR